MLKGEPYRWTINASITDAVLGYIYRDFRAHGLRQALAALDGPRCNCSRGIR